MRGFHLVGRLQWRAYVPIFLTVATILLLSLTWDFEDGTVASSVFRVVAGGPPAVCAAPRCNRQEAVLDQWWPNPNTGPCTRRICKLNNDPESGCAAPLMPPPCQTCVDARNINCNP